MISFNNIQTFSWEDCKMASTLPFALPVFLALMY